MNSLQQRLNLGVTISLTILFIVTGWLVVSSINQLTFAYIESRLEHDTESILTATTITKTTTDIDTQLVDTIYSHPFSGHYYQILRDDGTFIRSRSLWDTSIELPERSVDIPYSWYTSGPDQQTLLVWARHYKKSGYELTIMVAEDVTEVLNQMSSLRYSLMTLALFALILFITIQRRIITTSFKPLKQVQHEIKELESGNVSTLTESVPTEIAPVVKEVNILLKQLATRLQRSRTSVGNLAHALKTPLHLIQQQIMNEQLQQYPEIQSELISYTRKIEELVELELKRARLAGSVTPGQVFYPAGELPVVAELLKRIYQTKNIEITLDLPNQKLAGLDRDDMLELLGNLLDNAAKWAKQQVLCRIVVAAHITTIVIEDDGPGCNDEALKHLLERGKRIDETVSGHGIGLSIVKDIADSYGAKLTLEHSEMGGLKVQLIFKQSPY